MNDEIKEIDNSDLMELLETTSKKEFYRLTLDHELVVRLYNWITNLQEEVKEANENAEWWANRFNAVSKENKQLNERLEMLFKKEYSFIVENGIICRKNKEIQDYKSRIDKAKEYINHEIFKRTILVGVGTKKYTRNILDNVLNILNGGDE